MLSDGQSGQGRVGAEAAGRGQRTAGRGQRTAGPAPPPSSALKLRARKSSWREAVVLRSLWIPCGECCRRRDPRRCQPSARSPRSLHPPKLSARPGDRPRPAAASGAGGDACDPGGKSFVLPRRRVQDKCGSPRSERPPSPAPGGARPGRGCGGRAADAEEGRLGWGCRARRPDRGRAAGAGAAGCLAGEGGRDGRLRLGSGREECRVGSENRCPRSEAGPSRPEAPALGADLPFLDRGFGLCRLFWLRPRFNRVDCVTRFSGNVISSIKLQFLFRPEGLHRSFQRVPVTVSMGRSHLGAALLSPLAMLNQSAFLTLVTRSFFGSALKPHFSDRKSVV